MSDGEEDLSLSNVKLVQLDVVSHVKSRSSILSYQVLSVSKSVIATA